MANFEGIEFAKDYNKSFAEFKEEFSSTHVFKKYYPKEREQKLKEAYKIATNGNTGETAGKSETANSSADQQ
jgi:hypothetical protein